MPVPLPPHVADASRRTAAFREAATAAYNGAEAERKRIAGLSQREAGRELLRLARAVREEFPALAGNPHDRDRSSPSYFMCQTVPEIANRLGAGETRVVGVSAFLPGERSDPVIRAADSARLREAMLEALHYLPQTGAAIVSQLDPLRREPTAWDLISSSPSSLVMQALDRITGPCTDLPGPSLFGDAREQPKQIPMPPGADKVTDPAIRKFWGWPALPEAKSDGPDRDEDPAPSVYALKP